MDYAAIVINEIFMFSEEIQMIILCIFVCKHTWFIF